MDVLKLRGENATVTCSFPEDNYFSVNRSPYCPIVTVRESPWNGGGVDPIKILVTP